MSLSPIHSGNSYLGWNNSTHGKKRFPCYYSTEKPYHPVIHDEYNGKTALTIRLRSLGNRNHITYNDMMDAFLEGYSLPVNCHTSSSYKWYVGTSQIHMGSFRNDNMLVPISVFTIVSDVLMSDYYYINEDRRPSPSTTFVLFVNKDIASINRTLWKYFKSNIVRRCRAANIPTRFIPEEKFFELIYSKYEKPKFKSIPDMMKYKESLGKMVFRY